MAQNNLCKICGRFFEADNTMDYCPACKKYDDETYDALRNYLILKPRASVLEVTTELKIPIKVIKRFLREERLEIVSSTNTFLKCQSCGISINSGLYCRNCKTNSRLTRGQVPVPAALKENSDGSEPTNLANSNIRFL